LDILKTKAMRWSNRNSEGELVNNSGLTRFSGWARGQTIDDID